MSYEIAVFQPEAAPTTKRAFLAWYREQSQWPADVPHDDTEHTTPALRAWHADMAEAMPAATGASEAEVGSLFTEYRIGPNLIFARFDWQLAERAYQVSIGLSLHHGVGFYDASGGDAILVPNAEQEMEPLVSPRPWWKFFRR
ncbi:MAG: hypothetical protein AAGB22_03335 [Bacteroidota bacterium]